MARHVRRCVQARLGYWVWVSCCDVLLCKCMASAGDISVHALCGEGKKSNRPEGVSQGKGEKGIRLASLDLHCAQQLGLLLWLRPNFKPKRMGLEPNKQ